MNIVSAIKEIQLYKKRTAELYTWLSGHFAEDENARSFFFRMTMREQSHLDLARYQIRTMRKSNIDFDDTEINVEFFKNRISMIEDFRSSLPTFREALFFVSRLERGTPLCYCSLLMSKSNKQFAELLSNLSITCNMHCDDMREFIEKHLAE